MNIVLFYKTRHRSRVLSNFKIGLQKKNKGSFIGCQNYGNTLERGKPINGEYYANSLQRLSNGIEKKTVALSEKSAV